MPLGWAVRQIWHAPGFIERHPSDNTWVADITLDDFASDDAIVAHSWEGAPLAREHGGPVRLVIPHLYFWKSAKWVRGLRLSGTDEPGFWEVNGYNNYGDPWKEQRYWGD